METEDIRRKYSQIRFFPQKTVSFEELRKKQVKDTVKILGFSEEKIRRVEETLAKYETVDEAMDEMRKLGRDAYKAEETIFDGLINLRFESKVVAQANLEENRYLVRGPV